MKLFVASMLAFFYCSAAAAAVIPPDAAANVTQPITNSPKAILTMTSGLYTGAATNFSTGMGCPINFAPYVTITSAKTGKSGNAYGGKKICVNSLSSLPNNVNVNFQSTTAVKTIKNVTMRNGDSSARYVTTSPTQWTIWTATDFPPNNTILANSSIEDTTGDIYWVMYCYPPNLPPPDNSCT